MPRAMRYIIYTAAIVIVSGFAALGQQSDTVNRVIFKKNAAVRFYMGTTRDGANAVPLYVNSNHQTRLTASGKYSMTHLNMKLGKKIPFEVYADGKAPETGFGLTDAEYGKNKIHYAKPPCTISFSANDDLAGLESIFVSIDGAPFFECLDTISITEEKLHSIRFFSIDKVGNREKVSEIRILVDGTAPVSTLEIMGDRIENTIAAGASIVLKSVDGLGVKKIVYKIDDGQEYRYGMPLKASSIQEGEHTLYYYAEDNCGNREATQEFTFFVDKSAPIVFVEIVGNSYVLNGKSFSSGRSQLKVTAVDNKAGVKNIFYTINGKQPTEYLKPVFLSDLIGTVAITAFATDNVNNRSSENNDNQLADVPSVDISGPTLSLSFNGNKMFRGDTLYISPKTRILLNGKDPESGLSHITYRMDGAEEKAYENPFTESAEGHHAIAFTGFDNVENLNTGKGEFSVDATGPQISLVFGQKPIRKSADGLDIYPSTLTIFLGATDAIVGTDRLFYTINEQGRKPYSAPIGGFKPGMKCHVKVEAFDILGNITVQEFNFAIGE